MAIFELPEVIRWVNGYVDNLNIVIIIFNINLNLCFSSRPHVKDHGCYARIKILGHRHSCRGLHEVAPAGYPRSQRALVRNPKRTLMKRVCAFSYGARK